MATTLANWLLLGAVTVAVIVVLLVMLLLVVRPQRGPIRDEGDSPRSATEPRYRRAKHTRSNP